VRAWHIDGREVVVDQNDLIALIGGRRPPSFMSDLLFGFSLDPVQFSLDVRFYALPDLDAKFMPWNPSEVGLED
jgi:hypothetical protein